MKKLKLNFDQLSEEMEMLDLDYLKGLKGGYGGYYGYDTWEDFVGAVDGGYVQPGTYYPDGGYGSGNTGGYGEDNEWWIDVTDYGWEYGGYGYNGSAQDPYTFAELETMVANGSWNGGYVEGYGYVANEVHVFGGEGNVYTFSEYIESMSNTGIDQAGSYLLGLMDLTGFSSYVAEEIRDMHDNIQAELLNKGYTAEDQFAIQRTSVNNGSPSDGVRFDVYDLSTGQFITSRFYTVTGWYYEQP